MFITTSISRFNGPRADLDMKHNITTMEIPILYKVILVIALLSIANAVAVRAACLDSRLKAICTVQNWEIDFDKKSFDMLKLKKL